MGDVIKVATEDNLKYIFFPVSSGSVRFKVKALNDAHIALTTGPYESNPMREIHIGGWHNTKSIVRRDRRQPDVVESLTPGILSANAYRGLWVQWDNDTISAGREGESEPFISWPDPEPITINFMAVRTGWGSIGSWEIEVSPVISRPISRKKITGGELRWERMTNNRLPPDAMIGGFENEPIYIARAHINRSLCPGKYVHSKKLAFVPWGHRSHARQNFEILCGYNAEWVSTKDNLIPPNAFIAGNSEVRNEALYIGRAMHKNNLITGKVHILYNTCYLPYEDKEIEVSSYEILVLPNFMSDNILWQCKEYSGDERRTERVELKHEEKNSTLASSSTLLFRYRLIPDGLNRLRTN